MEDCYNTLKTHNEKLIAVPTVDEALHITDDVLRFCKKSTVLNSEMDEYLIIDEYETKKQEYLQIESELMKLRDIMFDIQTIVKGNSDDINTIDKYISHVRNQTSHAEMEIVYANTSDANYGKYMLAFASVILIGLKLLF